MDVEYWSNAGGGLGGGARPRGSGGCMAKGSVGQGRRRVGECVSGDVQYKSAAWKMIRDDHGCRDN